MNQQQGQQQQGQEIPIEEFVKETHVTVGELMMQTRMANRVIAKLQEENQALKQKLEEKDITGIKPPDDPESDLNLEKQPETPPEKPST